MIRLVFTLCILALSFSVCKDEEKEGKGSSEPRKELNREQRQVRMVAKAFFKLMDDEKYPQAFLLFFSAGVTGTPDYFRFMTQVQKFRKKYGRAKSRFAVSEGYQIFDDGSGAWWEAIICVLTESGQKYFEKLEVDSSNVIVWIPFEDERESDAVQRYETPMGRIFLPPDYKLNDRLELGSDEYSHFDRYLERKDQCLREADSKKEIKCKEYFIHRIVKDIGREERNKLESILPSLLGNDAESLKEACRMLAFHSCHELEYARKVLRIKRLDYFGAIRYPAKGKMKNRSRYSFIYRALLEVLHKGREINGTMELEFEDDRIRFRLSALELDDKIKYYIRDEDLLTRDGAVDTDVFFDRKNPARYPDIDMLDAYHYKHLFRY